VVLRGVSKIRLIDFDYVTLSSLNRHATAVLNDVGTPKVTCIAKTLKQIAKWVQVDSRIELWRKDEGGRLLEGADWVIGMFHTFLMRNVPENHILHKMLSTISKPKSTCSSIVIVITSKSGLKRAAWMITDS
jgi:hypothetical protein